MNLSSLGVMNIIISNISGRVRKSPNETRLLTAPINDIVSSIKPNPVIVNVVGVINQQ